MKKLQKVLDFVQDPVYHHSIPRQWGLEIARRFRDPFSYIASSRAKNDGAKDETKAMTMKMDRKFRRKETGR